MICSILYHSMLPASLPRGGKVRMCMDEHRFLPTHHGFDFSSFNSRSSDLSLCSPIPSQLSPSLSIPSVSVLQVPFHLREYDSILLTELLYFLWTKLLAISGHTKVSKSQADPYKNDLGDLSFYPQFYPLQIPLVALPDLLGGTPLLLFI